MKRLLVVVMVVLCTMSSYSQEKIGIYYNDSKVGTSRITGKKLGNLAGAYFSLGLSGAKRNLLIEGGKAELLIIEPRPTFVVYFGNDTDTGYIFSIPSNIDNLMLQKVKDGKHERKLQIGSYGLTGVQSTTSEKYNIPLRVEKIDANTFKVTPKEDLEKGQYVFFYTAQPPENVPIYNNVIDFGISNK